MDSYEQTKRLPRIYLAIRGRKMLAAISCKCVNIVADDPPL